MRERGRRIRALLERATSLWASSRRRQGHPWPEVTPPSVPPSGAPPFGTPPVPPAPAVASGGRLTHAAVGVAGFLPGVLLGMLTIWLVPLQLLAAVALVTAALTVDRPTWVPPLMWGGALGAALPWVMMMALSPALGP
jgi:hypothetical protein